MIVLRILISFGVLALGFSLLQGAQLSSAHAFEPPPDQDAPSSTAGGGSRPVDAMCTQDPVSGNSAIALAPQTFVGLSHQAQPTLWLYLPTAEVEGIEFSLFDAQLNGLVQAELRAPEASGFISIPLSEHATLSEGMPYYWTAAFICNSARRTEDWIGGGWIEYQPIASNNQKVLEELSLLDQADQYLETGYWYEALAVLFSLAETTPSSPRIEDIWDALLEQASLSPTLSTPWIEDINDGSHPSE